jgi:hypothetical protein
MSATKNNSTGMDGSHYRVPPEPNRWPAIGLAVGVHAVLLAFLVVGINWTNNQPIAVEAEVWDTSVQQAAPPAPQPPQAEPEPEAAGHRAGTREKAQGRTEAQGRGTGRTRTRIGPAEARAGKERTSSG